MGETEEESSYTIIFGRSGEQRVTLKLVRNKNGVQVFEKELTCYDEEYKTVTTIRVELSSITEEEKHYLHISNLLKKEFAEEEQKHKENQ